MTVACLWVYCSVLQLQDAIKSRCQIPADKQVLLISGGENLDPSARVCSYSAGTVSRLQRLSFLLNFMQFTLSCVQSVRFVFSV